MFLKFERCLPLGNPKSRFYAALGTLVCLLAISQFAGAATAGTSSQQVTDALLARTSTAFAINYMPHSHEVFFAQGLYWVTYNNGTDTVYQYSKDGQIFSSPVVVRDGGACGNTVQKNETGGTVTYCYLPSSFNLLYVPSSNTLWYVYTDNVATYFSFRVGHPNQNGSILWSGPESAVSVTANRQSSPQLAIGPNGSIWLSLEVWNDTDNHHIKVFEDQGSWSQIADFNTGVNSNIISTLLPLSGGKVQLVYDLDQLASRFRFLTTADGGRTWTSYYAIEGTSGWGWFDAISLGDRSYLVGWDDSHAMTILIFNAEEGSFNERTIDQSVFAQSARLLVDGNSSVIVLFNDNRVFYLTQSPDGGASWMNPMGISSALYALTMSTPPSLVSGMVPAIWEGDYPPVQVHFFNVRELNGSARTVQSVPIHISIIPWTIPTTITSTTTYSSTTSSSSTLLSTPNTIAITSSHASHVTTTILITTFTISSTPASSRETTSETAQDLSQSQLGTSQLALAGIVVLAAVGLAIFWRRSR